MSSLITPLLDRLPVYKTYVYVEEGQIKERDFDCFRWLGRKIFKWYPETHLARAATESYPILFAGNAKTTVKASETTLLKLLGRWAPCAKEETKKEKYWADLGKWHDIPLHGRYRVESSKECKLKSVDFLLRFENPILFSITKDRLGYKDLELRIEAEEFKVSPEETVENIKEKLKAPSPNSRLKILINVIGKMISDSLNFTTLRYYANSYGEDKHAVSANKARENGMATLKWILESSNVKDADKSSYDVYKIAMDDKGKADFKDVSRKMDESLKLLNIDYAVPLLS